MYKDVLEAKIRNGKWVKQPQGPKSIFQLDKQWGMQQKTLGKLQKWICIWRKTPRREIRSQRSFNDTIEPKSTSVKTQIAFLISEGDYGNTRAKATTIKPKNVNLDSWLLSKVKMVPNN